MKSKYLSINFLAIAFVFLLPYSSSAEIDDSQKIFDSFQSQLLSWTMESANHIAEMINDKIVFSPAELQCERYSNIDSSCTIKPLLGKGDHAHYKLKFNNLEYGRSTTTFILYLNENQHYDQYGNYSKCISQWIAGTRDGSQSTPFDFTNVETGKLLISRSLTNPVIIFESVKYPGRCNR